MTVKVFISGLSGNKEVKKRQQRVLMILDSKSINYTVIDITEPGKESEKEFMQQNSKTTESESTVKTNPLPPQIFNEEDYCGNYEEFDLANEMDDLEKFLKLPFGSLGTNSPGNGNGISNGTPASREASADKDFVPNEEREGLNLPDEDDDNKENEISNETVETVEMEEKDITEQPDESTVEETDVVNEPEEIGEESADQPEE